jgi:hypothetical protein
MRYGFSQVDWRSINSEIRDILIELARMERTISYSELAAQVTTAYMHPRAPGFHSILRDICRDEIAAGRPVIGVLVVNKKTGICGQGYFKFAAQMGADVSDVEAYWQAEFERVCEYWSMH